MLRILFLKRHLGHFPAMFLTKTRYIFDENLEKISCRIFHEQMMHFNSKHDLFPVKIKCSWQSLLRRKCVDSVSVITLSARRGSI